jgi:hypothetical protein
MTAIYLRGGFMCFFMGPIGIFCSIAAFPQWMKEEEVVQILEAAVSVFEGGCGD